MRNLDEETVQALKRRAARSGRSAEAEHREILKVTLRPRRSATTLKQLLLEMPAGGRDGDFVRPRDKDRKVRL